MSDRLNSQGAARGNRPMDVDAREYAIDPRRNVVLEASAGTGKTRVLVDRYVNLLGAGIEPEHILAITFTRKAAAEMRERIIDRLRELSRLSAAGLARWRDLKERLGDVEVSTIDAFCLSLLREFPLEADVDPAFEIADDAELPRLVNEALDQSLRACRTIATQDDDVALVFAQLGERRLRRGLASLLDRRLVAPKLLARYLEQGPRELTAAVVCQRAADRLRRAFTSVRGGIGPFLCDGPVRQPQYAMLSADITRLCAEPMACGYDARPAQAQFRALTDRLRAYFLTQDGRPREKNFTGTGFYGSDCDTEDAWRRHRQAAAGLAPSVAEALLAFRRDLNVVLSRGVWRMFAVTLRQYQRTLDAHVRLDFAGVLERAVALLENMGEFAQSRFRLEARYRHVLLDEFQDTNQVQWQLVAQLVRSWGEGAGAAADAISPSIFIVGDRKQSIYGFRDADPSMLDHAAAFVESLRVEGTPRRSIAVSFRATPEILSFVNDLFEAVEKAPDRADRFRYEDADRFPTDRGAREQPDLFRQPALGIVVGDTVRSAAAAVAAEVEQLLDSAIVRDRTSGVSRRAEPADVAVLFRSRDSHREFEKALGQRGVTTYVYKGLGFFDADEVQDGVALLRYLADPLSDLRAAAFLRSRIVRLSDPGLARLSNRSAPGLANAIVGEDPTVLDRLEDEDRRVLSRLREAAPGWLSSVDHLTPSELLGRVLTETDYARELQGPGRRQARENVKKLRSMIRRFQNRGYATLRRVADHLEELAVGDESNAALDARDAVSLMTVHGAKGLEFPIVFVVNLGRGTGGIRPPIRIMADGGGEASVAIADFQSEADEDAQAREREETKRLLYVALTRARDRLYLSATVEAGACRTGRGSLGEVLPSSVKALFSTAAAAETGSIIGWTGSGGRHELVTRRA